MLIRSTLRILVSALALVLLQVLLFLPQSTAAPAMKSRVILVHGSDGTRFEARLHGDEHGHLLTTPDGCAIALTAPGGDYHYLRFTPDGGRELTPWRAGDPAAPESVKAASRLIPRSEIARQARQYRAQSNALRTLQRSSATDIPDRHILVLLVQFSDLRFQFLRQDFAERLSSDRPESAASYFREQFAAAGIDFHIDVSPVVTLSHPYSYYGENDEEGKDIRPYLMIVEACTLADEGIDFSRYDDDGDGAMDNVFVYFAGGDEAAGAGDDHVWSHQWYLKEGVGINLILDNVTISSYACAAEITPTDAGARMAGIGTFCHEYSHSLGLIDYYDTDYEESGGESEALWRMTALMDGGNWNEDGLCPPAYNALDRYMLGLCKPVELTLGEKRLPPITLQGDCFILQTDKEGEFYLFECRSNQGWDRSIGGKGLLIYHIDRSDNLSGAISAKSRWNRNQVNCVPQHQCVDLIEADPSVAAIFSEARENGSLRNCILRVFFPWEKQVSYTPDTNPGFYFWSGTACSLSLNQIHLDGDDVCFTVTDSASERIPVIESIALDYVFQDAAIVSWEADNASYMGPCWISWGLTGKEETEMEVKPYAPGHYACVIEGLTPRKAYTAKAYYKAGGSPVGLNSVNFTTRSRVSGALPYIWFNAKSRNDDGSFPSGTPLPLQVYHRPEGATVSWRFNGEVVSVSNSGYYTPSKSGTLTAVINETDGTTTILQKQITIR